jgi:transcriptional regulator with XRE-family HTH domain
MPRTQNEIDKLVASRLDLALRRTGMSQVKLATFLGVRFQQVGKYVSGQNRMSAGRLKLAADAVGKPIEWFFISDKTTEAAPDLVERMLKAPHGLELVEAYLKIPSAANRVSVVNIARALAPGDVTDDK